MTTGGLGIGTLRSVLQNLIIEGREQQRRCLATDPAAASRAPVIMPTSDAHNHECARDPDRDRFFRLSASVDQRWNPITEKFGALPAIYGSRRNHPAVCSILLPASSFSRPVVIGTGSDPMSNDIIAPPGSARRRSRQLGSNSERLRLRAAADRAPWLPRRRQPVIARPVSP